MQCFSCVDLRESRNGDCRVDTVSFAHSGEACIGTNMVLENLVDRPMARENDWRMFLRGRVAVGEAPIIINLSWRVVGGRLVKIGWCGSSRFEFCWMSCRSGSAMIIKR